MRSVSPPLDRMRLHKDRDKIKGRKDFPRLNKGKEKVMKLNSKSWVLVLLVSMVLLATFSPMAFGAEKKVVKIGFIGPLTGPNAAVGLGARNSADLAIKQANEKGS